MRIKEGFILREVAGNIVVVPTGDLVKEFPQMITLNKVGKFIWELLQKEDLTMDEISSKIVQKYKIDEEKARIDTENFVENLKVKNILKK